MESTPLEASDERSQNVREELFNRGASVAAGLLYYDRTYLLSLVPFVVLPSLTATFSSKVTPADFLLLTLAAKFFSLVFLFLVSLRWMRTLSSQLITFSVGSLVRLVVFGFLLWFSFVAPITLLAYQPNASEGMKVMLIALIIPAAVVYVRYFFYFIPIVLHLSSLRVILTVARSFTWKNWSLPLKVLFPPIAVTSFVSSLIMTLSPDGRSVWIQAFVDIAGGIFPVLSSYLALGIALVLLSKNRLLFRDLDPYLEARLETIKVHAPKRILSLFTLESSVRMLALSLIVWAWVLSKAATMPPSPTITIKSAEFLKDAVKLTLELTDSKHRFRGFEPLYFALAGEGGTLVSAAPTRSEVDDGTDNFLLLFPRDRDQYKVNLVFPVERSRENLLALEDLYLWYRRGKIQRLDLKNLIDRTQVPTAATEAQSPASVPALGNPLPLA